MTYLPLFIDKYLIFLSNGTTDHLLNLIFDTNKLSCKACELVYDMTGLNEELKQNNNILNFDTNILS